MSATVQQVPGGERQNSPPPRRTPRFSGRLLHRLLIPYTLLILSAFSLTGWVIYHTAVAALDASLSTRLISVARVVSVDGFIKPGYLTWLGPGAEQSSLYQLLIQRLKSLRDRAGVADIFIVDGEGRVLLDADEEVPVGQEYPYLKLDAAEFARVKAKGETAASTLYSGEDGTLYKSGYAPLRDVSGEVIAVVGVEAGAEFLGPARDLGNTVLYLLIMATFMTALISVAVSRSIVGSLKDLLNAFGQVQREGVYPVVSITSRDEIGRLTHAFNTMSQRLSEKDAELTRLYELERTRAERIQGMSDRVLEGIPSGVIAIDLSARLLLCNQAAGQILGAPGTCPEDAPITDLLPPEHPVLERLMNSLNQQRVYLREDVHLMAPSGEERILGISAFPLGDSSQPFGAIAIFSDLTEVSRLQDQIKIQERLAALGELAAGIAHEIRNPLGAIRGFVELLGRKVPDESGQRIIQSVLEETAALNHIVTDFLAFAREPALSPELTDPAEVLRDAVALALPPEPGERIQVQIDIPEPVGPVSFDPGEVRKALINVIQNAVNAMAQSGGTLTVGLKEEADGVAFTVTDTGIGIPEALRDRIFNPFFTTRAEGTGLGLAITNKVVEGHGGRIHWESREGKGTRFTLWFPRGVAATTAHADGRMP